MYRHAWRFGVLNRYHPKTSIKKDMIRNISAIAKRITVLATFVALPDFLVAQDNENKVEIVNAEAATVDINITKMKFLWIKN